MQQFPWQKYSVVTDAGYCYCCRHVLLAAKRGSMKVFVADGFRNWKRSAGKDWSLTTHNASRSHTDAMVLWITYKSMLKSAQCVHSLADSGHQRLITENRVYIKTVCAVLRLTVTQVVAQRGHGESDQSLSQGNFLAILNLVAQHDTIVAKKIKGPEILVTPKTRFKTSCSVLWQYV